MKTMKEVGELSSKSSSIEQNTKQAETAPLPSFPNGQSSVVPRQTELEPAIETTKAKESVKARNHDFKSAETESTSISNLLGKWKWPLIAIVLLALLFGGIRIAQSLLVKPKPNIDKAVLTVATEEAKFGSIGTKLKVTGSIWARDPLVIGSEIGGLKVERIAVEEGDSVQKGQILAALNSSLIRAELERKEAQYSRARIKLNKTKQPNRPMDLARLEAAVAQARAVVSQEEANIERARANLSNAKVTTGRYKALQKEGAVSSEDLDTRITQERTYEAELRAADNKLYAAQFALRQSQENLKLAVEGGMKEDIDMAAADIAEIEAQIKHDRAQLEQTAIRAPSDGTIVRRYAHIGDITVANKEMFEMIRDNLMEVRADVPENDLARIKPGQKVIFKRSGTDNTIEGTVRQTRPQVDSETRLATVRIDIPFEKSWLPGMFVAGEIDLGKKDALIIPQTALISKDGRKFVFVLSKDNRVESRLVQPGIRSGELVEIISGLESGEKVIRTGAGFLKDGDLVRLGESSKK